MADERSDEPDPLLPSELRRLPQLKLEDLPQVRLDGLPNIDPLPPLQFEALQIISHQVCGNVVALVDNKRSVFICYAHEDNANSDPQRRWLDRLLQFVHPLVRQENLKTWSDRDIKIGEDWHARIRHQLEMSLASILIISPAFLASDYIANSELPVLLKHAFDRGTPILPIIVSPCLYEHARFRFPDPKVGPKEILLSSIQSANPPSRTLVEMSEAEQNRVLLTIALRLSDVLVEYAERSPFHSQIGQATRENVSKMAALPPDEPIETLSSSEIERRIESIVDDLVNRNFGERRAEK